MLAVKHLIKGNEYDPNPVEMQEINWQARQVTKRIPFRRPPFSSRKDFLAWPLRDAQKEHIEVRKSIPVFMISRISLSPWLCKQIIDEVVRNEVRRIVTESIDDMVDGYIHSRSPSYHNAPNPDRRVPMPSSPLSTHRRRHKLHSFCSFSWFLILV